jgi:hypothetical protein
MRRGGGTLIRKVEGRAAREWAVGDDDDDSGREVGLRSVMSVLGRARRWLGGVSGFDVE